MVNSEIFKKKLKFEKKIQDFFSFIFRNFAALFTFQFSWVYNCFVAGALHMALHQQNLGKLFNQQFWVV